MGGDADNAWAAMPIAHGRRSGAGAMRQPSVVAPNPAEATNTRSPCAASRWTDKLGMPSDTHAIGRVRWATGSADLCSHERLMIPGAIS